MNTKDEDDVFFQLKYTAVIERAPCHLIIEPCESEGSLFLGNYASAQNLQYLKDNKITVVLDVSGQKFVYPPDIVSDSKSINLEDYGEFDLSPHLQECFDFIHKYRNKGKNILVHCAAGASRSAIVVIGYLMVFTGMGLEDAYKFVYSKRKCIYPNPGFLKQLRKLEKELKINKEKSQDQQLGIKDVKTQ